MFPEQHDQLKIDVVKTKFGKEFENIDIDSLFADILISDPTEKVLEKLHNAEPARYAHVNLFDFEINLGEIAKKLHVDTDIEYRSTDTVINSSRRLFIKVYEHTEGRTPRDGMKPVWVSSDSIDKVIPFKGVPTCYILVQAGTELFYTTSKVIPFYQFDSLLDKTLALALS